MRKGRHKRSVIAKDEVLKQSRRFILEIATGFALATTRRSFASLRTTRNDKSLVDIERNLRYNL